MARGRPFQKGNQAGKGHGRPPGPTYVNICREWAEKNGWARLIGWANGDGYKAGIKDGKFIEIGPDMDLQFQAAKTLIEYGYGKPRQAVDLEASNKINIVSIVQKAEEERGL